MKKINAPTSEKRIDRAEKKKMNKDLHKIRCAAFEDIKAGMCEIKGATKADRKADNKRIWAEVVAASLAA